jgi:hypothetical protein
MENDFSEVMKQKSDGELIEIVTRLKNDYQPAAVAAAETEIKSRRLSATQIEQAELEIEEKLKAGVEKENEPLGIGQKLLFLLFFWGVVPWAMAGTFKAKGYTKKYKDAWKFMKIGIAVFFGIPLIIILIITLIE